MQDSPRQLARAPFAGLTHWWVGFAPLVLLVVGCHNNSSQQDAYIRDLRMHEQKIYELQDYMSEYQALLCEQRKENAALREKLASRTTTSGETKADDSGRSLLDPADTSRRPADDEDFDLPMVDPGVPLPTAPGLDDTPEIEELPSGEPSSGLRRGRGVQSASFVAPPEALPPATAVALYAEQMSLEPSPEGTGDEVGLMAIVEPLTATGAAGDFRGEMSLMIVDPIAPRDGDWQIARWDYTAEEVEQSWRSSSRRVMDLPLAAPPGTPIGRPLELWIQLLPGDGSERILARTMIELGEPARLVGVGVSGGAGNRSVSSWQAADPLPKAKESDTSPQGSWQPSTASLSQPANRSATQTPAPAGTPDWTPRR